MKHKQGSSIIAAAIAGLFSVGASGVHGAGFQLIEQNASGMGNAFAGSAAVAEDASTVFFNPAGMSLLEGPQFAAAGHAISLSAKFAGTGTTPAALGGGAATGGNGGDAGGTSVVPNVYFVMPYNEQVNFGLGVNVPFGLTTEYDANWVGRFQGIKSEVTTLNINPSVSYKVNDTFSIGGGINYQLADAELTNALVLAPLPAPFPPVLPGKTKLEVDGDAWGWNIGAMFQASPSTRVGVAYRSEIEHELDGNVTTTVDANGSVLAPASGPTKVDITLPDTLSLSIAHAMSDQLQILADVTRTGWSSINKVNVVNTTNGTLRDVLVLDFDDSWRYSIGANYRWSEAWTLKAGLAFDETPVKGAATRTVRLPDNDRTWISFGGQTKVGQNGRIDFGYSHLFIDDADINNTRSQQAPGLTSQTAAPNTASNVTGSYEGSVDIFSVQYSHIF